MKAELAWIIGLVLTSGAAMAVAQGARAYFAADICHNPRVARCMAYPGRISYHRSNCRWVEETSPPPAHSLEVCLGKGGVWRPSGRG